MSMRVPLLTRSIRPPDDLTPNENDPASVPPATVGPPAFRPGDPVGIEYDPGPPALPPPRPSAMPWSGWPAEWSTPAWTPTQRHTDTVWTCLDLNSSLLATMAPYLVGASDHLDAEWLRNPDPAVYSSWEEFAKQLFWDYHLGEAFVLTTARYATGYPARFHVVAPWYVNVEIVGGVRRYSIGAEDVSADMCHLRYTSRVGDAHGHGPLEAGATRLIAADVLNRYAWEVASNGGIPSSVLEHPDELSADQADELKRQWVDARTSSLGEPAVLSGGVTWRPTQLNPEEMTLHDLLTYQESRIAVMLGVPPFLVGLPVAGNSMTYSNVRDAFDFHWRAGLRPKATFVMAGLSEFLLPRGTTVEINRDSYVQPPPLERAQTAAILAGIRDEETGEPALRVSEIRETERLNREDEPTLVGGPTSP